jgi:hypothetical protein
MEVGKLPAFVGNLADEVAVRVLLAWWDENFQPHEDDPRYHDKARPIDPWGPFEARDVLNAHLSRIVSEQIIEAVLTALTARGSRKWEPHVRRFWPNWRDAIKLVEPDYAVLATRVATLEAKLAEFERAAKPSIGIGHNNPPSAITEEARVEIAETMSDLKSIPDAEPARQEALAQKAGDTLSLWVKKGAGWLIGLSAAEMVKDAIKEHWPAIEAAITSLLGWIIDLLSWLVSQAL